MQTATSDGEIPPEIKKCAESSGFQPKNILKPSQDLSSEEMCFFKCVLEEKGVLDENGDVDLNMVDYERLHIPDDKKEDVKQCLRDAGKVQTCDDMGMLIECISQFA